MHCLYNGKLEFFHDFLITFFLSLCQFRPDIFQYGLKLLVQRKEINLLGIFLYRTLPNTHASPNRHPPPSCLDLVHVPEVSRPDLPVHAVYRCVKCCINDLLVACHEIIQMYTKNSAVSQLITVTGPKSQVAIFSQ